MSVKALLVSTDKSWMKLVQDAFKNDNISCARADSASEGLNAFNSKKHDIAILEFRDLCQMWRALLRAICTLSDVPVIVLSSMVTEAHRIEVLDAGASHVLDSTSPMGELLACTKAALRRTRSRKKVPGAIPTAEHSNISEKKEKELETLQAAGKRATRLSLVRGGLKLDPSCSSVKMGTSEVALTSAECQILRLLMMNERRCVTREQILELLHGQVAPSKTRLPQVYMSRLRLKLRRLCGEDEPIANIKGSGWVFRSPLPRAKLLQVRIL